MAHAIPCLCQLLGSKTPSDVLEIIDFFIVAHEFGLTQSEAGIRKMANLIWARDPVIKKAVVAAFERLYIDVTCENPRYDLFDRSVRGEGLGFFMTNVQFLH